MAHLVTDRIVAGLRWTAIALYIFGVAVILGAMAFTHSVEALVNAVWIVGLSFALPATALLAFAFWLDMQATTVEDAVVATVPLVMIPDVRRPFREPFRRYLVAVLAVLVAWGLRAALDPLLASNVPFITFFLAVAVTGWLGGFGPAVVASALSTAVAWYFFVSKSRDFTIGDVSDAVGLGLFLFMTLAIGSLTAALHTALWRITELRKQIAKLTDSESCEP